jgi:hypothetical protein
MRPLPEPGVDFTPPLVVDMLAKNGYTPFTNR